MKHKCSECIYVKRSSQYSVEKLLREQTMVNAKTRTSGVYLLNNQATFSYDALALPNALNTDFSIFDKGSLKDNVEKFISEIESETATQTMAYAGFVFKAKEMQVKQVNGRSSTVIAIFQSVEKLYG